MAVDLSALSTEDLIALKGGDLSRVSTAGLQALRGTPQTAAQQVASDPITQGAQKAQSYTPAELIAGSAPGRFLLEPARGLLELGSHLGLPGGESAKQTGELIQRGREAYGDKGLDIAGIAGQVASPAVLKVGKLVPAGANLLQRMAGSAATGATAGALTPTADKGNFWTEKAEQTGTGAAGGALLPPAGALAKGVLGATYRAIEPILPSWLTINPGSGPEAIWNRFKGELAGPAKEKIVNALMSARELVPGSKPTAGEAMAALPEASPLAALQQQIAGTRVSSPGFITRAGEQEGARAAALGTVAKTPADLAAAEAARAAEAATNYGRAFSPRGGQLYTAESLQKAFASNTVPLDVQRAIQGINASGRSVKNMSPEQLVEEVNKAAIGPIIRADPTIAKLAEDPYFKKALPDAIDLAASKGINAKDNLTQFLHYVKVGLDKQLSRTGDTALASTEKEAVQGVKNKLTAWMDEKNPAYAAARGRFAEMSKPINQMEVGRGLQEKLAAPLGTQERAAGFASAVRSPESLIKSEVGGPARTLEQILTPEQLSAVNAVGSDLGRKAQFERLARGTKLGETPGTVTSPIPQLWSRPASITNYIAKKLFGHNLENRISAIAGPEFLDPTKFAQSLRDIPLAERHRVVEALLQRVHGGSLQQNLDALRALGHPIVSGAPSAAVAQQY